jgi:LacI family transcriptional regulator
MIKYEILCINKGRIVMDGKRVRIVDIADELGLSTATVSNVIHGKTKKISDETVKRVQELLEKREYIPSMAGILLAQNSSRIIGVIVNNHEKYEGHVLEDGFVAASLNALVGEVEDAGYFMMVKVTDQWNEITKFASMWNVAGLVLIGFCERDYQKLRDNMRIPFVIYDGFLEDGHGLVNLVIDHYDGGRQMGNYLKKMGHRKVLCIADNDICMDHERFQGLQSVLPAAELMVVPMKKEERELFYQINKENILTFTAIFAVSDYYAIDILRFLLSEGIEVPKQISVSGFDDSMMSRQMEPALTTIGQNHLDRARLAMDLLEKLRNHEKVNVSYTLPVTLIERKSTGHIY